MDNYLIGIDIGTTGTKAMLFSDRGRILGHAYHAYSLNNPKVGYSEQNAEDWWNAVQKTVREVVSNVLNPASVKAIAISSQGGTLVPVDEMGRPLRSAIVWNDSRCRDEENEFEREVGTKEYVYQTTGWKMNCSLPMLEIRWIKNHEPEVFERTAKYLTVPDFISLKMTGKAVVDIENAGINQLFDIRENKYDKKLMNFTGVEIEQLPEVLYPGSVIGNLTDDAASALGLTAGTLLVAGAHDQYAAAVGGGVFDAGSIMIGSGTSWVITKIENQPDFSRGLSQSVAVVPGMWGSISALSTGGVCLDWLRKKILPAGGIGDPISFTLLNQEIKKRHAAEDGLFFFPFSGRNMYGNNSGKGAFLGLDLCHDGFDMAAAVMEGVSFQVAWLLDDFHESRNAEKICLSGGASRSRVWSQMLADITGKEVEIPVVADLACVGAAVIAGYGTGLFDSIQSGYRRLSIAGEIIAPNLEQTKRYQRVKHIYRRIADLLGQANQCS